MIWIILGLPTDCYASPEFKSIFEETPSVIPQWFPASLSQVSREIDHLFWLATYWTAGTGLIVLAILGFFIVRYRKKRNPIAFYTHGDSREAVFLTLILAGLVFVALDLNLAYHDHKVWDTMFGRPPAIADAMRVEIMPEQFAWNIRYAGEDQAFGTPDDVVTMNELHTPVNKPVIVQLSSRDVIHSFFLPNLRIKQDSIPGMITTIYFQPEVTGEYNIACAQHCGLGHYRMKGAFVVQSEDEFKSWLAAQPKEPSPSGEWAWDWNKGLSAGGGPVRKESN